MLKANRISEKSLEQAIIRKIWLRRTRRSASYTKISLYASLRITSERVIWNKGERERRTELLVIVKLVQYENKQTNKTFSCILHFKDLYFIMLIY